MERYDTLIDGDEVALETPEGEVTVGSMADVCEILGGETYTIEYDDAAQATAWLRTDDEGTVSFDVRETVADLDFDRTFVEKVAREPIDRTGPDGYPRRTERFAELLDAIWSSKGQVDLDEV